jgi:hypothetical protein
VVNLAALHAPPTRMNADRAQILAERLHSGQRDRDGTLLIDHVRRVAAAVSGEARAVAWLHEALEHTSIPEQALLAEGITHDGLRAIRLLTHVFDPPSDASYLAHLEGIARARGPGADIARAVKRADLTDRVSHPSIRPDGWSPPYARGLQILGGGSQRGVPTARRAAQATP